MASATLFSRSVEVRGEKEGTVDPNIPSPDKCKSFLDLGITLALFLWPSLTLAVNSCWGGPESQAKREWFASITIDLVAENPGADADWIEEFLLNVMFDEFEVNVEDDSALEIAETIVRLRKDCAQGNWAEVLSMKKRWDAKDQKIELQRFIKGEDPNNEASKGDDNDDFEEVEEDEDDESEENDTDKASLPRLSKTREPVEIDEDGFTKVTKKKR